MECFLEIFHRGFKNRSDIWNLTSKKDLWRQVFSQRQDMTEIKFQNKVLLSHGQCWMNINYLTIIYFYIYLTLNSGPAILELILRVKNWNICFFPSCNRPADQNRAISFCDLEHAVNSQTQNSNIILLDLDLFRRIIQSGTNSKWRRLNDLQLKIKMKNSQQDARTFPIRVTVRISLFYIFHLFYG